VDFDSFGKKLHIIQNPAQKKSFFRNLEQSGDAAKLELERLPAPHSPLHSHPEVLPMPLYEPLCGRRTPRQRRGGLCQ
jgi:hypothetical protein